MPRAKRLSQSEALTESSKPLTGSSPDVAVVPDASPILDDVVAIENAMRSVSVQEDQVTEV